MMDEERGPYFAGFIGIKPLSTIHSSSRTARAHLRFFQIFS